MFDVLEFSGDLAIVECRLIEWGRWEHYRVSVQRPGSPGAEMMGISYQSPSISDDEATLIQESIAAMKRIAPEAGRAVEVCFFSGRRLSVDDLGRDLGVSRSKAALLLREGLHWLQGHFVALSRAA